MPEKTSLATVKVPAFPVSPSMSCFFSSHCLCVTQLSPAPTSTAAELVRYTEMRDDETPDIAMENVGSTFSIDDKKKGTAPLIIVIQKIATANSKTRQDNTFGRAAAAGVATDMKIREIIAEGEGSIQTNSF